MKAKKHLALVLITIFSAAVVVGSIGYIAMNARAILVNPRLGSPLLAPATSGNGETGTYIDGILSIYVATDPADAPVPSVWLAAGNWEVGLVPVALQGAPLVSCSVEHVEKTTNPLVSYGAGDASWLSRNAIRIDVKLPASIQPGSHHLHVAFKQSLATATLAITPGLHQGPTGSGSELASSFVLSEPNCIYVPWVNDSRPSDPMQAAGTYHKPWSFVQLSDIHFGAEADARLQLASSEVYTSAFKDALSILAPDLLVATGDLTRDPFEQDHEYQLAHDWFVSLGLPVIMSNGNHDQKNAGLWPYFFGPQVSVVDWAGATFVSFNSVLPISGGTTSMIVNEVQAATSRGSPVILACHVPLMDVFGRQTSGSAAALVDAMVRYNGTAILQGHNHYNLVMDAATALDRYLTLGDMKDACEFTGLEGEPLPAIDGPKLIITSSVGYEGRDSLKRAWSTYIPTTSFRHVVLVDNRIANYTYDMDGDGLRDASYSTPVFDYTVNQTQFRLPLLNSSLAFNELDLAAGANYTIFNNLTETILGARVAFVLPIDTTHRWQLDAGLNGGLVIHERSRVSNGTHEFIDFRLTVPRWSSATVHVRLEAI